MNVLTLDAGEEPDMLVVEESSDDLARTPFSLPNSNLLTIRSSDGIFGGFTKIHFC